MGSVAEVIVEEFASGQLYDALDSGLEAVLNELSDVLDGILMAVCPPYNAAMSVVEQVPKLGDELTKLKRMTFRYVMELLHLDELINYLIIAWKKIPVLIRDGLKTVTGKWKEIVAFWDDPSWNTFTDIVDVYAFATAAVTSAMSFVAEYGLKEGPKWLIIASDTTGEAIADVFDAIGASVAADTIRYLTSTGNDLFQVQADQALAAWNSIKSGEWGQAFRDVAKADPTGITSGIVEDVATGDVVGTTANILTGGLWSVFD